MTCIVGMCYGKRVFIGADNVGSNSSNLQSRKDGKVFIKKSMIFGCTSSYRMIQLLRYKLNIPDYRKKSSSPGSIHEYMYTKFIDAVRKCFVDNGYMTVHNNVETGGTFLVGFKGHLFQVQSDLQIAEPADGYWAIGSGMEYALGAMKMLIEFKDIADSNVDLIETALKTAEYYNPFVRGPFEVLSI